MRELGDVQQGLEAGGQLHEGAKVSDADHFC